MKKRVETWYEYIFPWEMTGHKEFLYGIPYWTEGNENIRYLRTPMRIALKKILEIQKKIDAYNQAGAI